MVNILDDIYIYNPKNFVTITTPNDGSPAFSRELTAQQNYFLVTTGRRATDFGAFTNTISGSGKIVAVPESDLIPGTLAALGAGLLLCKRKRGCCHAIASHLSFNEASSFLNRNIYSLTRG
ncbi:hypothetical protein [Scytonema sp. NUACC26]|uniref:hypothetical protein n=1 Tax=Scytonema sp. NUACC26 TaxID=3140176 RepID=UPI0034DC443D